MLTIKKKPPVWKPACKESPEHSCELTSFDLYYFSIYKLRVRASVNGNHSAWAFKEFCPDKDSKSCLIAAYMKPSERHKPLKQETKLLRNETMQKLLQLQKQTILVKCYFNTLPVLCASEGEAMSRISTLEERSAKKVDFQWSVCWVSVTRRSRTLYLNNRQPVSTHKGSCDQGLN